MNAVRMHGETPPLSSYTFLASQKRAVKRAITTLSEKTAKTLIRHSDYPTVVLFRMSVATGYDSGVQQ